LGPLLDLVLIGDIDRNVTTAFVSSFADDTRVGHRVRSEDDVQSLQADLLTIYQWASSNNMVFNSDKFECLRYGKNKTLIQDTKYTSSTGSTIQVKECVRDLGVTLSCDATFTKHVENTVKSSNMMCGWILRTFLTREAAPLLTLWKSMVLAKLDYCCQLWNPHKKGDIQALENVQRSFIRKISGLQHLNYWEKLHELRLYSLQRRRERYMIIYTWKILEGSAPNMDQNDFRGIQATVHVRRGRSCRVPTVSSTAPAQIQNQRQASLAIHGSRLFNCLPLEIRMLTNCSTESFKRRLDSFLMTVPDEPQLPGYTAFRRAESNSLLDMVLHTSPQNTVETMEDRRTSSNGGGHPWPPWD